MERIVNRRLVHVLDERKLVPKQQFGFRKKLLYNRQHTEHPHHRSNQEKGIHSSFIIGLMESQVLYCCRHRILKTVKTWKINGRLLGFTKNFMNDCTLRVAIGNTMSSFKNIENGVPQRAVLSVTLFLVAMAKI
jgi:hypothetical protein